VAKFLIIRFSSIGDIVLTTPVVRCLKKQVEGAEIHYFTKKQFSSVLSTNPYIDRLWLLEDNLGEINKLLAKENFDYIIDLHNNLRSLRVKLDLRKKAFSFDKINLKKWLIVHFKINFLPDNHIADRYLGTLKYFGVKNDFKGLDYFLSGDTIESIKMILPNLPDKFAVLVIGAQHETKKASPEVLADICNKINLPIAILGGIGDQILAESIVSKINNPASIVNAVGLLSLNQSALLVKNAALVITHDTGLMHIAAAFKKKIVSIWGNTIPEFGMSPYLSDSDSKIFEVKNLKCRPCSKIEYQSCPKLHFKCMKNQNSTEIANYINNLVV
jgi:ADP-heptose:LPS heptosyltransferase